MDFDKDKLRCAREGENPEFGGGAYERREGDWWLTTDISRFDFAAVHRLLSTFSYWCQGISREYVERAAAHSLCFGVFREGRQIAYARVVTDYARFGWLCDVIVDPKCRGQGVGKWMVARVFEHPDLLPVENFLLGTKDAHGLYAREGFVVHPAPERMMTRRKTPYV